MSTSGSTTAAIKALEARRKRRSILHPDKYASTGNGNNRSDSGDPRLNKLLVRLRNKPFWLWDSEHNGIDCCFNHIIGLPEKDGQQKPLFAYEQPVVEALQSGKHLWCKKATGAGISELGLRWIVHVATRDNALKNCNVCLVTGPRIDLTETLLQRIRSMFADNHNITLPGDRTTIELAGCRISGFPSHHIASMRGLTQVKLVYIDEGDFIPIGSQDEVRAVAERYIGKSQAQIVWTSTPDRPDGLFARMELEDPSIYDKHFIHYSVCVRDGMFTPTQIAEAMKSRSFPREYGLEYLGSEGNVFSPEVIESMIQAGRTYDPDRLLSGAGKALGIDPAFGSSKFAVVLTQLANGRIEIVYAEQWERPQFSDMIKEIVRLMAKYYCKKAYVDASNPAIIMALKREIDERTDYENVIADLRSRKVDEQYWARFFNVVPVNFATEGKDLLGHLKFLVDSGMLAVNPKFGKLITALRTATAKELKLDKEATSYDDLVDALRCAVSYYHIPRPLRPMYSNSIR